MQPLNTIWTIGHSTHTAEGFIEMLKTNGIKLLADVRSFPGSRRYPHFNKEQLGLLLQQHHIQYIHLPELGGRRKTSVHSKNTGWRNDSFRGYADYMETKDFKDGINGLQEIAAKQPTAYMCSEAVWWRCHRSLISDYLKNEGWKVMHILSSTQLQEHPYTSVANIKNGTLSYEEKDEQAKIDFGK